MQTAFQIALLPLLLAAAAAPEPHSTRVPPGSVLRWPGESLDACGLDGRQWQPLEGACWYPVDLLATGELELERWIGGRRETRRVELADYPYEVQRIELEDDTHVHLSEENLARAARESAKIRTLWSREGPFAFELPLSPPLADPPAGGRFGARRVINGEPRSPHSGVDYAADRGEPVLAVADGEVILAEEHFFAGNSVFIDHGGGLISMSFHLSQIDVEAGEHVSRGQPIGRVGATGRATGPHLHFGLRWHGARVDPAPLFASPAAVRTLE